ncbi:hypothetical protein B296_00018055, partial [Ensete ventricosum]
RGKREKEGGGLPFSFVCFPSLHLSLSLLIIIIIISISISIVALLFSFFSPISSPRNRQAATADREEERPLLRSPKKEIASGLVRSSESASIWGRAGKLALLIQSFLAVDFGYEVILFAWTGDGSLVVLEKSVTAERYNFRFPV